jgi:hypothetical protein
MSRYDPPDPLCRHKATVRVSNHTNLMAAFRDGLPTVSTHCCDREACQEDAKEWVRASAKDGREPVVVGLQR